MLRLDEEGMRVDGDELRLTMPAAGPYTRLARVAVTGLATRLGFSFDEVEDLRLAVADVCTGLLAAAPEADKIDVSFVVGDGHLAIDVAIGGAEGTDHRARFDEITASLGDASVDSIEYLEDHGVIRVAKTHVEED